MYKRQIQYFVQRVVVAGTTRILRVVVLHVGTKCQQVISADVHAYSFDAGLFGKDFGHGIAQLNVLQANIVRFVQPECIRLVHPVFIATVVGTRETGCRDVYKRQISYFEPIA